MQLLLKFCLYFCLLPSLLHGNLTSAGIKDLLFDSNNSPMPALVEFLEVFHISHAGTVDSINQAMQKRFLIKHVEDWKMPEDPTYDHEVLIPLLTKLGLFGDVRPRKMTYDGAILLGGHLWSMRSRIAYMVKLWNEGCRFKKIIIMTGEHALDKGRYTYADLFEYSRWDLPLNPLWQLWKISPKNEAEMISMVLEQVKIPQELRDIPCEVIVSTMDPQTGKRPTTLNNAVDFFNRNSLDASYLVFSNQPFVGYQHAVFITHEPAHIAIDTVGPKAFGDYNMAMYLDRLTRWIYQESVRRKTQD